jgi:hypothetical protein
MNRRFCYRGALAGGQQRRGKCEASCQERATTRRLDFPRPMDRKSWSAPTDPETAARRNAGRRRHNATRRMRAENRRYHVAAMLAYLLEQDLATGAHRPLGSGLFGWGIQTEIANALGVHRSTISRDLRTLLLRSQEFRSCPGCGRVVMRHPTPRWPRGVPRPE